MKKLILVLTVAVAGGMLLAPSRASAASPSMVVLAQINVTPSLAAVDTSSASSIGTGFLDAVKAFAKSPLVRAIGALAIVGGLLLMGFAGNIQQGLLYMGLGAFISFLPEIIDFLFPAQP